jgi:hypothetical protein
MAQVLPPIRATEETAAEPVTRTGEAKEQARLAQAIEAKVAQGYRIESRTDLQALVVKGPRRRLGIMRRGGEKRELVSINEWGHPKIEQL